MKKLGVVLLMAFGTVFLASCTTVRVVATPMTFDPATMVIVGYSSGSTRVGAFRADERSYLAALELAESKVGADGMLNPQIELYDEDYPLFFGWLIPKRTKYVRVSGICFKYKAEVMHQKDGE
jgi:hypothetical protein